MLLDAFLRHGWNQHLCCELAVRLVRVPLVVLPRADGMYKVILYDSVDNPTVRDAVDSVKV